MKLLRLAIPFVFFTTHSFSQQLGLSRLFYPNATVKAEYFVPSTTSGGDQYGLTRTSFMGIVPIQSEVQLGYSLRKKFDLKASHTVAIGQFSQLQPTLNGDLTPSNGYKTVSLSVIRLQASIKDRMWVYGGGLGISESNETFFTPQPFLWGGAARMRMFGLQTQLIYGTVLIYNQKFRIVPVIGFNKRLTRKWRATAILPFMADVNYKVRPWFNIDMLAGLNGYSSGFQIQTIDEKLLRRENYKHIKLGISANAHLFTVLNISLEGGVTGFRTLRTFNSARENLESNSPRPTPYIGASVRYITSRSSFSSKFTKKLGLGGLGNNW